MTEMLELMNGDLVPMTAVRRLRPVRREAGELLFEALDDDGHRLGEARERDIENVRGTVVPAAPGWRAATFPAWDDEGEFAFWFQPIVAWRVGGEFALPVTIDGTCGRYVIVAPDGHVTDPHNSTWDSLEEAAAELDKRRKEELARRVAAP